MKTDNIPLRKILVYLIYILILPSLQVLLSGRISFFGHPADLMLVFVVLTGFLYGFYDGIAVGAIVGLARDVLSPVVINGSEQEVSVSFGIGILVMMLGGVFGSLFFEGRTNRNFPLALAAVVSYSALYKILGNAISILWQNLFVGGASNTDILSILLRSVLPALFINAVAVIPLFLLLRFLGPVRWTKKRGKGGKELTYGDSGKWLTI